jgi:hypothetical protein
MFTATFFFLGLAICIFAGLVCFAMSRSLKAANAAHTIQPSPDEKAAWERLKKALIELHTRYEGVETVREKTLRSWVGTLVICAGLCMIGILLETRYDMAINVKSVVSGLVGGQQHISIEVPSHSSGGHVAPTQDHETNATKNSHANSKANTNTNTSSNVKATTNTNTNSNANTNTRSNVPNTNSTNSKSNTDSKSNTNSKSGTNTLPSSNRS